MLSVHLFFVTLADLNPCPIEAIGTMGGTNRLDVQSGDTNRPTLRALGPLFLRRLLSFFCEILLFCHSYLLIIFSLLKNPDNIPACLYRLLERLACVFQELDITCLTNRPADSNADRH
jgi:hypothetical protein